MSRASSGLVERGVPLSRLTTIGTGGPAAAFARPRTLAELEEALRFARANELEVVVLGLGSNVLAADPGVDALVLRLTGDLARVEVRGERLVAGGGAANAVCLHAARRAELGGLEFACAIPGTAGGGVRMNAGAYGREIKDVFAAATAIDRAGTIVRLDATQMGFAYRHTDIAEGWIFLGAELRGVAGDPEAIGARIRAIRAEREDSQPTQARTGGSTFANPPGRKAWELIAAAGCRGLARGGAQVSPKHTNFLINTGTATAAALEALGEEVRARVKAHSGVDLRWEIRRIGVTADHPDALVRTP